MFAEYSENKAGVKGLPETHETTQNNNDMHTKTYTSPSVVKVELALESGFAASFGNDASNGAKNFIIGQDSSSYDSTWE